MKKILLALLLIAGTSLLKASENEQQEIEQQEIEQQENEKQEFIKKYIINLKGLVRITQDMENILLSGFFNPQNANDNDDDIYGINNIQNNKYYYNGMKLHKYPFSIDDNTDNIKQILTKLTFDNYHRYDYMIIPIKTNAANNNKCKFNIPGDKNPAKVLKKDLKNLKEQKISKGVIVIHTRPYNLFSFTNLLTVGAISLIGWFTYSYFAK